MRDFKGMKRQRGRNRKPSSGGNANNANPNRSWDSQGPENIKVRGNAQTVYERYQQLARDAGSSGDRVLAENYLQHAEHYFRVLRALQPQRPVSEIAARELTNQGFDIDFEDETGAQAAAFLAAQQAADRAQQQTENRDRDNNANNNQDRDRNQDRGQDRNQDRAEGNQNREWRDRDQNRNQDRDRDNQNRSNRDQPRDQNTQNANAQNRDRDDRAPRADADASSEEGEIREGGRRETRRERWERRREERNRRFEAEGGQPGGEDTAEYDATKDGGERDESAQVETVPVVAEVAEPASAKPERAPRRARAAREPEAVSSDEPVGLPSFLTRSTSPVSPATLESDGGDAEPVAPKRRAPRRKVETPIDSVE